MSRTIRRLMPPKPAYVLYARAAELERRGCELSEARQSRRLRRLAHEISTMVEKIADERSAA